MTFFFQFCTINSEMEPIKQRLRCSFFRLSANHSTMIFPDFFVRASGGAALRNTEFCIELYQGKAASLNIILKLHLQKVFYLSSILCEYSTKKIRSQETVLFNEIVCRRYLSFGQNFLCMQQLRHIAHPCPTMKLASFGPHRSGNQLVSSSSRLVQMDTICRALVCHA